MLPNKQNLCTLSPVQACLPWVLTTALKGPKEISDESELLNFSFALARFSFSVQCGKSACAFMLHCWSCVPVLCFGCLIYDASLLNTFARRWPCVQPVWVHLDFVWTAAISSIASSQVSLHGALRDMQHEIKSHQVGHIKLYPRGQAWQASFNWAIISRPKAHHRWLIEKSFIILRHHATKALSKSFPPSRSSPLVKSMSSWSHSTHLRTIHASNVPPPKSATKMCLAVGSSIFLMVSSPGKPGCSSQGTMPPKGIDLGIDPGRILPTPCNVTDVFDMFSYDIYIYIYIYSTIPYVYIYLSLCYPMLYYKMLYDIRLYYISKKMLYIIVWYTILIFCAVLKYTMLDIYI